MKRDRQVVTNFVEYRSQNGLPGLRIESFPDELNRVSADIDAIAGRFAIEHTSIDTLPYQRRNRARFEKIVRPLRKLPLPRRHITISFEYDALRTGQNWNTIRAALKKFVLMNVPNLLDGPHLFKELPDIPFAVHVLVISDLRPRLTFGILAPSDETLSARLRDLLVQKVKKLIKYRRDGYATVLLVESQDISLMNERKMLSAMRDAFPDGLPDSIQHVWYADTSLPSQPVFIEFTNEINMHEGF